MRRLFPFVLVGVLALAAGAHAGAPGPWERVGETDDGIVVFMREVPGTTIKEVKAQLEIAAPPRIVLDAACDPKSFRKSLKYVEENRYFWIGDPDVWFTYQRLNYPVVTRRDYVMRYEREIDPDRAVYRLSWATSTEKGPPPREDAIRVTLASGEIEVVPRGDGKRSLLRFRLLADPGGSIPGWVINIANQANLSDIIREIRSAAARRQRQCQAGRCEYWDATSHDY